MALGSKTYTSVTWTTGDTATETKMDNMVNNDQAYDSHAAEGLLLNNNTGLYQKDSGGTNREVFNVDGSNVLHVGDSNVTLALDSIHSSSVQPRCIVGRSTTQTLGNGANTNILWNSEELDTDTMHDNSTESQRITFTTAGFYLVYAYIRFADSEDTLAGTLNMQDEDSVVISQAQFVDASSAYPAFNLVGFKNASAADWVMVRCFNFSAQDKTVQTSSRFGAIKLA